MKATRLQVLAVLLLGWASAAPAQVELPPAAREVLQQLEDESAELEKKLEADVRSRERESAAELKEVQDRLCRQGRLDDAVAVRDLLHEIESGDHDARPRGPADPAPAEWLASVLAAAWDEAGFGLPAEAREVRRRHDRAVDELYEKAGAEVKKYRDRAAAELEKVQGRFCQEAKLDEALAVRDMARQARAGVMVRGLPDPGYVNNPPADIGKTFYYDVTGVVTGGSIYGTGVYTTGSHLAMAAVHSGVLRPGQRGVVKVTILPGRPSYEASTRHGVTSVAWGAYGISFKVERAYGLAVRVGVLALADPGTLTGYRDQVGKSLLFEVTGSNTGSVWGADVYTDDSSLATAAVHAGLLLPGQKGVIKVTILPGQDSYPSLTRSGVTSGAWGAWTGSFRVEPAK
jgi:hypothetical protein